MHLSCFEAVQEMPQVPISAKDMKHLESRKTIQMIHLNWKATSVEPLLKVGQTCFCKICCLPHDDDKPTSPTQTQDVFWIALMLYRYMPTAHCMHMTPSLFILQSVAKDTLFHCFSSFHLHGKVQPIFMSTWAHSVAGVWVLIYAITET
mmetsp:Transcript_8905/g.31578  ORF Transcript_8905/g.31578 Transcript_8905/m.31578 type:complete len:149 (+) Transcript_8905:107-553(+)